MEACEKKDEYVSDLEGELEFTAGRSDENIENETERDHSENHEFAIQNSKHGLKMRMLMHDPMLEFMQQDLDEESEQDESDDEPFCEDAVNLVLWFGGLVGLGSHGFGLRERGEEGRKGGITVRGCRGDNTDEMVGVKSVIQKSGGFLRLFHRSVKSEGREIYRSSVAFGRWYGSTSRVILH